MTTERRRHPRHSVELPAEVSSANELLIGETVDLSLGGVRIVVDDMLDVGATVRLTLSVPAASAAVVTKSAGKTSGKTAGKAQNKSAAKTSKHAAKSAAAKRPKKRATAAGAELESDMDDSDLEDDEAGLGPDLPAFDRDGDGDGDGDDSDTSADADLDPDLDGESGAPSTADDEPFESSMTVRWTRARPDGRCVIGLSFGPLTAAERKELARVLATLASG